MAHGATLQRQSALEWLSNEQTLTLLFSTTQAGTGLALYFAGRTTSGATLLLSGLSGGLYSYGTEESKFRRVDWLKASFCGALSNLITDGMKGYVQRANSMGKLCGQVCSFTLGILLRKLSLITACLAGMTCLNLSKRGPQAV